MSATEARYTLEELSVASGVSPRTIRYYTAEGLLPPPSERGRYAIYGAEHLARLQLIGRLKAEYLPLAAIRERLAAPGATQAVPELRLPAPAQEAASSDFGFRVAAELGAASRQAPPAHVSGRSLPAGYAALFPYPEDSISSEQLDESGELWQRIMLAPGVELHLRAPVSDEQRERVQRLIDEAKALFGDRSANARE